MDLGDLTETVVIASLATVGLMEFLKNFVKTKKTWIYSAIMLPLAAGCYFACKMLPVWVIGGILTIGFTQLDYQILVQGIQNIVKGVSKKMGSEEQ